MKKEQTVLLLGGSGHAPAVFSEWQREGTPVRLVAAAQTLSDESLDDLLRHPWAKLFSPRIYATAAEALASETPEIAVVSTRPGAICRTVRQALEAGLDVIAEKPLAVDSSDLADLFALVKKTGRRVLPMFGMRASPVFLLARTWVQEDRIGDPLLVHARKSYKWGVRPAWFGDRIAYGGTWPWVGIHALDMTHFITGLLPVSVTAHHANHAHPDYPGCEDICAGVFKLNNGGLLTVNVDFLRPSDAPTHGDDFCRITGTKGVIEAYASAGWIRMISDRGAPVEQNCGTDPVAVYTTAGQLSLDALAGWPETVLAFQLTDAVLQARSAADNGVPHVISPNRWNI